MILRVSVLEVFAGIAVRTITELGRGFGIGRKKKAILRCSHLDLGATDAWYKRARKQPLAPAAGPT